MITTTTPVICERFSQLTYRFLYSVFSLQKSIILECVSGTEITHFTLNVEPEETFHPWAEPGAIFALHSPFLAENPFSKGHVLRPGSSYHIHVRLEEEHLLPHPYKTDCIDYESLWKSNNKKGSRSQQDRKGLQPSDGADFHCERKKQMLQELGNAEKSVNQIACKKYKADIYLKESFY
ncbi:hypothetical protein CEXT_448601 [Caerostris extrusa]|uniref:Uncharacterized protein n=1 Tax=Caerostris extrusa TaxID=172846 RepID=A0AAV4UWW6_CAEEX|nr:hypothetical protein CEXT_448601 [Caerostris extrusa]